MSDSFPGEAQGAQTGMPGIEQGEHRFNWTRHYVTLMEETCHITACFSFRNEDALWEQGPGHFLDIVHVLTEGGWVGTGRKRDGQNG